MSLMNKRYFLVMLFCMAFVLVSNSQTLYWVSGSGNFNDPQHWSLHSGDIPANKVPDANTRVIFDDNSGSMITVVFNSTISIQSLYTYNNYNNIALKQPAGGVLNCTGDFSVLFHTFVDFSGTVNFRNPGSHRNKIWFGLNSLKCNLSFREGSYAISALSQAPGHKMSFDGGNYKFLHSSIITDRLEIKNDRTVFQLDSSYFSVRKSLIVKDNPKFDATKFVLYAPFSDTANVLIQNTENLTGKVKTTDNTIFATCGATLLTAPMCNSCQGGYTLTIGAGCAASYNILVTPGDPSSDCITTANNLDLSGVTAGSYTYAFGCVCSSGYLINVNDDNDGTPVPVTIAGIDNQFNFNFSQIFPSLSPVFSYTAPNCNTSCNGRGNFSVNGGTGPYTVSIAPFTTPTFSTGGPVTLTTICGGSTYTFLVTDSRGCVRSPTITLAAPSLLNASQATRTITCPGACTGGFSISPGGTGTGTVYTVRFNPGGTFTTTGTGTVSVGGLCTGPVTATLTDAKGCTVVANTTINQPPIFTVTPTQTNVTCGGSCTGAASVAVLGGTSPYSYTWSPGGGSTAGINALCSGGYTVNIKDNNNCTYTPTPTFSITEPAPIVISPTVTNVSCNGFTNGSATVTSTGGSVSVNFTWVSPAVGNPTVSTTGTLSGAAAGVYTVFARDAASCVFSKTVSLQQPPSLTITATSQSIQCIGATSGTAGVVVTGGNGSYTYTWTNSSNVTVSNTPTVTGLQAGSYTLTAKDASSCAISTVIVINQPTTFTPAITSASVSCNGACTGTIGSTTTGGTLPYSYTLVSATSSTVSASPSFTGLCAGGYTLNISDASSPCAQVFNVTITEPLPIVPSINTTSITCFNSCNGSLAGNVLSGGNPGYTFNWTTPTGTVSGSIINNLCIGTYVLNVMDTRGCTKTLTTTLTQPPDITYTITPTSTSCFGSCNGALSAAVSGGVPGYTLNWSNAASGNPNSGLCAGIYTLNITDLKGCVKTGTAAVLSPSIIALTRTTTATSCANSCDGSSTITANGGFPPFLYAFNTVPAVTNTTGIIGGLCFGNYISNVSDVNGCSQSITFSVTSPTALSVNTSTQNSCSSCNGAATVTPSNGSPGYTYAWTNSLSATVSNTTTALGLCPGAYTIVVTDSRNCTATASVNILETVVGAPVSGGTGIQCFGACTGSAVVTPFGGIAPYTYTWTPSAQNTQTATALCAGIYTVTVKEGSPAGCTSSSTIQIISPPLLSVTAATTNVTCSGLCNGVISATATGGTGAMSYSWSPGGQTTSSITGLCAGSYSLKVTDANGCTSAIQTFTITEPPSIAASLTLTPPTTCTLTNGSICASASGGQGGPYSYTWMPVASNATCLTNLSSGAYSVSISDAAGCGTVISTLLNNPNGPTLTPVSSQSVNCFGGNTGAASFSAAGSGPFTFSWTPSVVVTSVGNVTSATGLNTGTYILTVQDANSCVRSISVGVVQASSLTVNTTVFNPKCNNAVCNGSITVTTPSGGTPPYSFAWSPGGATTQNLNNICAGNYTLQITDSHACPNTYTFNVTAPPAFTITSTSSSIKCNGACSGSIVANAGGGTGAISYTWLPMGAFTGSTTATVLGLCAGIYTVNAFDGNNCMALGTNTIQITEPALLTSTLALLNISCSNSCNAVASTTASGGTLPYAYSWSTGTSTNPALGSLCAGNYTGTTTDANGCAASKVFTVVPPAAFTATLVPANPKCNPLSSPICSGSVATTLSGAQGAVSFNWIPSGSGQNPANLCAGTYTLIATDANSCQVSQVVNLVNPPALLSNATHTNPSCNGVCNGRAVITPTNAVGAVSVTWTPSAPNSQTVTGLCSGSYTVNIRDANGCADTETLVLIDPQLLVVNTSNSAASCTLANGVIIASPSGGSPGPGGYSFSWTPAVSTTSIANNLSANIYTLLVSDGQCSTVAIIPLSNADGPSSAPIVSSSVSCFGQCTGAASINPATIVGGTPGGALGYTVSWTSPPSTFTTNPQTNLCAGIYTAKIRDNNNCILFNSVTIDQPNAISILPNMGFPTCMGVCNGSISLNTSGGSGAYTYTWLPNVSSSSVLTSACPGNYTVIVGYGAANSCTSAPELFTLPAVTDIGVTTSVTPNPCFGNCIATASITTASGVGSSQFTYAWSNGQNGLTASNFCNGSYSVVALAPNGCTNTFSFQVTSPSQIASTVSVSQPSCNQCNGGSSLVTTGGVGSVYSYSWTNGATTSSVSNLCAGLYQVIVTDGANCSQTQTIIVNSSNGITGETFNTQNILCGGVCNGAATVTATGGNAPITYNWLSPSVTGQSLSNLCEGTYFVQMADAQGCLRTSSVNLTAASSFTISDFIQQPGCAPPTAGSISVIVTGGTPGYVYQWQPSGATTPSLTNLSAGSYSFKVTDSSPAQCSLTQVYNISNLTGPVVTFTQTNIKCSGACSGSVTAFASGVGNTYHWSTGSTVPVVTNLCPGIITLTVTDAGGCKTIRSFTITENTPLLINTPQITQPTCNMCNGSSTVTPFGGVLPYTYSWATNATGASVSSLCAGIYEVMIADGENCQQTFTVIVNNSNGITGQNFNVQNILCGGNCNGSATVSAVGGNLPISYNWVNPALTNSVISNLCQGTYFVQMTDAQNCIRTASVDITAATSLTITSAVTSPSCGGANGAISLNITGGTPGYTVSWFPSGIISPTLSGIGAGSFTATIHDTSPGTCTVTQGFNVSNTTGPVITFSQTNIKCFGTCNGSISISASTPGNPAATFAYNWSNGVNTATATNLCKGVVTLTVTDLGTSCSTIRSFTITSPSEININPPSVGQPSCDRCNGTASISVFGGVAPYQYVWTTNAITPSVKDLCAGLYQVQVTDALQCSKTNNVLINSSNGITGETIDVQNIQCPGSCNGSATVTAIGGSAPVQYSWINPLTTGPVLTNLCQGNYFVQMTDAQGCIRTASLGIMPVNGFSISPASVPPTCGAAPANGSVNVIVNGGSGSFQYLWMPSGNTTAQLNGVDAGNYSLTVTDAASGCSLTTQVNLSNPTGPAVTFTASDINCFGTCTGSITAASTSTNALTYSWSAGSVVSAAGGSTLTGLCKGVVTVTVTDNVTGCKMVNSFSLGDHDKLQLSVPNVLDPLCHNSCDGQITLLPSGGSLPYLSFSWTPTGSGSNPQTSLCAGSASEQVYTVTINDARGCTNTSTVVLKNPQDIALSYSLTNPACSAVANGSIGITPSGGTASYSPTWTGPGAFSASTAVISSLFPGSYTLHLADLKGCSRDTIIDLVSSVSVQAQAGPDATICPSALVVLSGTNSSGTGSITFSWYNSTATLTPISTSDTLGVMNATDPSTFILQVSSQVPGCFDRDTVILNILPLPEVDAGPTFTIPLYSTVTIGAFPTVSGDVSVFWTPTLTVNDPTLLNPIASNTVDTEYYVTATDNATGCKATDSTMVILYPAVIIPSGFSPNGDGKNDRWIIDYLDQFKDNTVEVYNRWGDRLFNSQGYNTPFDGRYHNQDLPVGTYYYVINLNHPAYPKALTGPLTIFR